MPICLNPLPHRCLLTYLKTEQTHLQELPDQGLILIYLIIHQLPWSGEKVWNIFHFPGQGKVREFHFQSGKFRKNEEREFKKKIQKDDS